MPAAPPPSPAGRPVARKQYSGNGYANPSRGSPSHCRARRQCVLAPSGFGSHKQGPVPDGIVIFVGNDQRPERRIHVLRQYESDLKGGTFRLQLMNEVVDDLLERLVDISDKLVLCPANT
jgi:hypothetical protein